jgi:hypothetical protein
MTSHAQQPKPVRLTKAQVESIVKVYEGKLKARYRKIVEEEKGAMA